MTTLSLIVPVYNEAENIDPLIAEIRASLDNHVDYEVIYVDDGSIDDTSKYLLQAMSRFPCLRVLHHHRCCGQSTALYTGVRAARSPWIVTLDGDGQNDPADILKLFAVLNSSPDQSFDLIIGHRRKRRDSWLKRMYSRAANAVRAYSLKDNTPDTGCGLKIIAREAYLALPYFDHMHRFLPALIQRQGGRTVTVDVNHRPRIRGISNYGVYDRMWSGIIDLLGVVWLNRRMRHPVITEISRP